MERGRDEHPRPGRSPVRRRHQLDVGVPPDVEHVVEGEVGPEAGQRDRHPAAGDRREAERARDENGALEQIERQRGDGVRHLRHVVLRVQPIERPGVHRAVRGVEPDLQPDEHQGKGEQARAHRRQGGSRGDRQRTKVCAE